MASLIGSMFVSLTADWSDYQRRLIGAESATAKSTASIRRNMGLTERSVGALQRRMDHGIRPGALIAAGRSFDSLSSRANLLRGSVFALSAAFGGLGAALTTNVVSRYLDTFTNLENQMRVVSRSSSELTANINAVAESAARSRAAVGATATLFSRIAKAAPLEGTAKTLRRVETINKALQLGGATAQESASAAIQFSQAIASNRLGGEELRAVLETPLGLELAKGLGVTIGKFREMGYAGELTANVLFGALDKISGAIDRQFLNSVMSIDAAFTIADSKITQFAGRLDDTYGITRNLSAAIVGLGNNLDTVVPALGLLGAGLGTFFASRMVGAAGRGIGSRVRGMREFAAERRDEMRRAREAVESARAQEAAQNASLMSARTVASGDTRHLAATKVTKEYGRALAEVQKLDANHLSLLARKGAVVEDLSNIYRTATIGEMKAAEKLADQINKSDQADRRRRETVRGVTEAYTRLNGALGLQATTATKLQAVRDAEKGVADAVKERDRATKEATREQSRILRVRTQLENEYGKSFTAAAQQRANLLVQEKRLTDELVRSEEKRRASVGRLAIAGGAVRASGQGVAAEGVTAAADGMRNSVRVLDDARQKLIAAERAASGTTLALGALRGAGSSLVAFLGGGWGVAFTVATGFLTAFGLKALEAAEQHKRALEIIRGEVEKTAQGGGAAAEDAQISILEDQSKALKDQIDLVSKEYDRAKQPLVDYLDQLRQYGILTGQAGRENSQGLASFEKLFKAFEEGKISVADLISSTRLLRGQMAPDVFNPLIAGLEKMRKGVKDPNIALASLRKELEAIDNQIANKDAYARPLDPLGELIDPGPMKKGHRRYNQVERQWIPGRADYGAAQVAMREELELRRRINDELDSARNIQSDIVSRQQLLNKEQEMLEKGLAKTRETARQLAEEFFARQGKVVDWTVRIGMVFDLNPAQMQGVPRDLQATLLQRMQYGAGQVAMREQIKAQQERIALPRRQYGAGQVAMREQMARAGELQRLMDEAADTGDKALNTQTKVNAKAQDLLEQGLFNSRTEAEKFAREMLNVAEANRQANKTTKQAADEFVKFGNMIKELREEGQGAFLSDLDRSVLEKAKTLKDGSEMMRQYIDAINSGDMSRAPAQLLEIRDALMQIGAAGTWREIVQNYGNAGQMAGMFADKQAELNMLVASGRITAGQAASAWADYIGQFKDYKWIEQTGDALGQFVIDVTEDFKSVEDAFKNLIKSLARIALQETVINPFKEWFRSSISSLYGGGATGQGGNAAPGFAGLGRSAISTMIGAANQNMPANVMSSAVGSVGDAVRSLTGFLTPGKDKSHVTGMDSEFASRLSSFLNDAPGKGISIYSGYRSPARQAELFNAAVKKYGSVAAARKWVAPPGRSQHNHGNAADLRFANDSAKQWAHQNASAYGLNFRMGHEPWHIEKSNTAAAVGGLADKAKTATEAIDRMTTQSTTAAQALGGTTNALAGFGGGLSNLAQSLMNVGGGAGGGGWFSGLMSLFGGAGGATSYMMGISPAATMAIGRGAVGLFAEGGQVTGPGGPKSDKIPALLSNGEFVVKASAVRGNRAILDAINSGAFGRFAEGGFVYSSSSAAGNSGGLYASMDRRERDESHVTVGVDPENGNLTTFVDKRSDLVAGRRVGEYDWRQKRGGNQANANFHNRLKRQS